ncbi:hypothetical protein BDW71DRAFT_181110, partial [Aspergillus fruticulosus]
MTQTDGPQSIGMSIAAVVGDSEPPASVWELCHGGQSIFEAARRLGTEVLCAEATFAHSHSPSQADESEGRLMALASAVGLVRAAASLPTPIIKPQPQPLVSQNGSGPISRGCLLFGALIYTLENVVWWGYCYLYTSCLSMDPHDAADSPIWFPGIRRVSPIVIVYASTPMICTRGERKRKHEMASTLVHLLRCDLI